MSYLGYATEEQPEQIIDISNHLQVVDWGSNYVILQIHSSEGRSLLFDFYQADGPVTLIHGPTGNSAGAPKRKAQFNFRTSVEGTYIQTTARLNRTGSEEQGTF
ncbi:MAG TPA: hypothetical protein VGB77_02800 [Abditibacteriaceae bacterium]|jgi:hypothetical protein